MRTALDAVVAGLIAGALTFLYDRVLGQENTSHSFWMALLVGVTVVVVFIVMQALHGDRRDGSSDR